MINYNDPLEVIEIYAVVVPPKRSEEGDYPEDIQHLITKTTTVQSEMEFDEVSLKHSFCWEDIKGIRQQGGKDVFKRLKGDKYFIKLQHYEDEILVLGNYHTMVEHWKQFRNAYPLFRG